MLLTMLIYDPFKVLVYTTLRKGSGIDRYVCHRTLRDCLFSFLLITMYNIMTFLY